MLKECIRLRFFPLTVILEADKISLFPLWPSKWLNKGRRHSWYLSNRTWPPSGEYWMRPRRRRPLPRWRIHSSWWSSSVSSHTHLDRIDPAEIKQWNSCSCKKLASLPYFVRRSITVRMTFCLTGLNLTKKKNLLLIQNNKSSWIQTNKTLRTALQRLFLLQSRYLSAHRQWLIRILG